MSKIKELQKEITDNVFQLDKDELELIILHIQSLINKKYMGEQVNLLDVYMKIEQLDKRLQQMDEDLVSIIYDRGIKDGSEEKNIEINEGFMLMSDMAWQLINRIEDYDKVQAHAYREDWNRVRAGFTRDGHKKIPEIGAISGDKE